MVLFLNEGKYCVLLVTCFCSHTVTVKCYGPVWGFRCHDCSLVSFLFWLKCIKEKRVFLNRSCLVWESKMRLKKFVHNFQLWRYVTHVHTELCALVRKLVQPAQNHAVDISTASITDPTTCSKTLLARVIEWHSAVNEHGGKEQRRRWSSAQAELRHANAYSCVTLLQKISVSSLSG